MTYNGVVLFHVKEELATLVEISGMYSSVLLLCCYFHSYVHVYFVMVLENPGAPEAWSGWTELWCRIL